MRAVSLLVTAMVMCEATPAATQTVRESSLDEHSLLQAQDPIPQRPDDGQSAEGATQNPSLFRDIASDYGRFFSTRETYLTIGLGIAGSLSVRPLDDNIVRSGFNSTLLPDKETVVGELFEPGRLLGSTFVQVGSALATYGIGNLLGKSGVAELGRDLVRTQALTQGVTQFVKHTVRRERPDGSNQLSYPSGHASGTFATATVLQRHFGWKVGIPAFGMASYVAGSRLAANRHHLSDVVFGAAIGVAAGRTVTFSRGSTRFEISPVATPGGAAVQLSVVRLPWHTAPYTRTGAPSNRTTG